MPSGESGLAPLPEASPGDLTGLDASSPEPTREVAAIARPPNPEIDWQKPTVEYLRLGTIPDEETKTRHLMRRATGYLIHNNELYRRNTSDILQRYIPLEEGKVLLLDIHEGICGHHASSRSKVRKAFQQGFYWPTVTGDAV
jgi:hypothetical protein